MDSYIIANKHSTQEQISLVIDQVFQKNVRPISYIYLVDLIKMSPTDSKFITLNKLFNETVSKNNFKNIKIKWISTRQKYICITYDNVLYFYEFFNDKHVSFDLMEYETIYDNGPNTFEKCSVM